MKRNIILVIRDMNIAAKENFGQNRLSFRLSSFRFFPDSILMWL